jgi:hypothetical protein
MVPNLLGSIGVFLVLCIQYSSLKHRPLRADPQGFVAPDQTPRTRFRIFDCFIYNNEALMLLIRLRTLHRYVTTFVLEFGSFTFSMRRPPTLSFSPFESEISTFASQLSINLFNCTGARSWQRERALRDHLLDAVNRLNPQPDDLLIVSDCDEIMRPSALRRIIRDPPIDVRHIRTKFFYYSLRYLVTGEEWIKPFVIRYGSIRRGFTRERLGADRAPAEFGAVHCSYCFGSISEIIRKLETFPHTEFSYGRFVDPNYIYACVACAKSMFRGRFKVVDYDPQEMDYPPSADYMSWRMPFKDMGTLPLNPERIRHFATCQNPRIDMVNGTLQPWVD